MTIYNPGTIKINFLIETNQLEVSKVTQESICGVANGFTPLCYAANLLKERYVTQLIEIGGAKILNLGSQPHGWTPLFFAASKSNGLSIVNILIGAGSDVNMPTVKEAFQTPKGATPLWASLEKSQNASIAALLIINNAKIYEPLTSKGKLILTEAINLLFSKQKLSMLALKERLLPEIISVIFKIHISSSKDLLPTSLKI